MSIQNVGLTMNALVPAGAARAGGAEERRPVPARPANAAPSKAPDARSAAGAASAVPVEAPAGTDPELWSVLTTEERAYFAKFQAAGPLTYGPKTPAAAEKAIPRGGRLDVTA